MIYSISTSNAVTLVAIGSKLLTTDLKTRFFFLRCVNLHVELFARYNVVDLTFLPTFKSAALHDTLGDIRYDFE